MATTKTTITTWAMRPSVRPTTASTTSETTRATCTSPERARRAHSFTLDVVSHLIGSSPESFHIHPWSSSWRTLFDLLHPFYFYLFLPVSFSFHLLHSELYPELDNPIAMQNLRYSANKRSDDAYDVSSSLTGYEPNFWPSASSMTHRFPSPTLSRHRPRHGWRDTRQAAHRGTPRTSRLLRTRRRVSQSVVVVCCVRWIRETWWREKCRSSLVFGVTRNPYCAHSKFSENTRTEKMVDGSVKPGETAQMHRLGLYLKNRDRWLSQNIARKLVITNSKQLMQKKNAEFYEKNYGDSKWNFVKFINKVLQRWRNYENFKDLPSIRSQDESSSRTRTLFWNYQAEYKNHKMK